MKEAYSELAGCTFCGLVQEVPPLPSRSLAECARCGATVASTRRRAHENRLALAATLAAALLFPLAVSLPIMRLERLGHRSDASIWTGSVGLLAEGELFVGGVVLLCSFLLPLLKLASLLVLTGAPGVLRRHHRAPVVRAVELAGRWGMLDVLLIAVVVAWVKIGDLVEVTPGPAATAFTLCVVLSLLAGAWFDPRQLFREDGYVPVPEDPA